MRKSEKKQLYSLLSKYYAEQSQTAASCSRDACSTLLEHLDAEAEIESSSSAGTELEVQDFSAAEQLSLLRVVLNEPGVSFWLHDHTTDSVKWSQSLYKQLGYNEPKASMSYKDIPEIIYDADREYFWNQYEEHLQSHQPMRIRLRMCSNSGELRHFRNVAETSYDEAGQPLRSVGVMLDLTRLAETRQRLQEKESETRHLFESMKTGAVYHQADGPIFKANPAAARILGLSMNQLLGRDSMHPEWHAIRSDGSPFPGEEHPAMQALATGEPVADVEMGVYHPHKKEYAWILVSAIPEFRKGESKPYQVFATFSDITAQRRLSEQLTQQARMHELLADLALKFINLKPEKLDNAVNHALQPLGEFVEADRAYVFEYDFAQMECSNTHEWCAPGIEPEIDNLQNVPINMIPQWWTTHKRGEALHIKDVFALDESDGVRQILEPQGIKSLLALPIILPNGSCWGFVGLDSVTKHHRYSNKELDILKVFTKLMANVLDRVQQLKALNESQQLLSSVIDHNPLITAIKDQQGRYLRVNSAWEETTGLPAEATLGKTDTELFNEEDALSYLKNDTEVLQQGRVMEVEEVMTSSGAKRYFKGIKFPLYNAQEERAGMGLMINEVTELRQAQKNVERFSKIVEQSPNEVYIFDGKRFFIQQANHTALRHLGYSAVEIQQLRFVDIKPDLEEQAFRRVVAPLLEGEKAVVSMETYHQTKQGKVYPVELQIQRNEFEGETWLTALAVDITERKKNRKIILKQNKTLKGIAWQQSHEVRAPLARLLGLVEMLHDEDDFPELQHPETSLLAQTIEHIFDAASELDHIVSEISKKTELIMEIERQLKNKQAR